MGPVYFDIVPIGTHACRLFILYDGELEAWDYRFHWAPRTGVEGHWKEVRRIPVAWNEPFLALPDGADRLFLATSTGAIGGGVVAPHAVTLLRVTPGCS